MRWRITTRSIFATASILVFLILAPMASAQWQPDPDDKRQVSAAAVAGRMQDRIPRSKAYFEDAYGYAILPSVTRFGFGYGGAYGRGIVVEGDNVIGTTSFWQFTSGIQAGAKYFSMVVFFKDEEALEYYKQQKLQFLGQAGIAFATIGAAGTPAYNDGVAIITLTRFGLMGEFTISGARYRYKSLSEE